MAEPFERAEAGDQIARDLGFSSADELISSGGTVSFANMLAARQQQTRSLLENVGTTTAEVERAQGLPQAEFTQEATSKFKDIPEGMDPSAGFGAILDLAKFQKSVLEGAESDRTNALNVLTNFLTDPTTQASTIDTGKMLDDRLSDSQRKELRDKLSALSTMQRLNSQLKASVGDITDAEALQLGITGPGAKLFGDLTQSDEEIKELRASIDVFQDRVRKDLFGSAFTETEKKVAALPGSGKQETRNMRIFSEMITNKLSEVEIVLKDSGLSDSQIASYLGEFDILQNAPKDEDEWEIVQ